MSAYREAAPLEKLDDQIFEGTTRVPGWAGVVALAVGLALCVPALGAVIAGGFEDLVKVIFAAVFAAAGVMLVIRGVRTVRDRGKIAHVIRGTPEELSWGPTGTEVRLPLRELKRVGFLSGESSVTIEFELLDGRKLHLGDESAHLSRVFRFVRLHFKGEMIWNGRVITDANQVLY